MKGLKPFSKLNILFAAAMIIAVIALAGCKKDKDPVKVSGVSLNKPSLTLTVSSSETLAATVIPANAENKAITWAVIGDAVTIDQNGKVTAVKAGEATVTVTTADGGFTATSTVNITAIEKLRYETVPYSASEAKSGEPYKLIYSTNDDEYNYYIFLLGHVISVPLAYRDALYYDGVTPVTISYSQSDVTQESISTSVGEAAEYSFTKSSSSNWEFGFQGGIGITLPLKIIDFKLQFSYKTGGSSGWDETDSRSLSNTLETSLTTTSESGDGFSVTIGEHSEPVGAYRYALFSITDVYYYVVTDRAKTRVVEAYTEFCARPDQQWRIDYEPDNLDDPDYYGKTAKGELLEIPEITPSMLPNPEDGLDIEWGEWVVTKEATCETAGEETRTGTHDPSRTETRTVPATGHQWGDWVVTKEATETTAGEEVRYCTHDPLHKDTPRVVPATEHQWGEWVVTKEPTCETAGEEVRTSLLDPSLEDPREIPATGHQWGAWKIATIPTCTTEGKEVRTCINDPSHKDTPRIIPATGHRWGAWGIATAPTCETAGEEARTCTHNPLHKETTPIPATGHQWGEWVVLSESTASLVGKKARTCEHNPSHMDVDDLVTRYYNSGPGNTDDRHIGNVVNWRLKSNLNIEELKGLGYKSVDITINFDTYPDWLGSNCILQVYEAGTNIMWGSTTYGIKFAEGWKNHNHTFNVSLDKYDNNFFVHFGCNGASGFTLGERTVTVTAKR